MSLCRCCRWRGWRSALLDIIFDIIAHDAPAGAGSLYLAQIDAMFFGYALCQRRRFDHAPIALFCRVSGLPLAFDLRGRLWRAVS